MGMKIVSVKIPESYIEGIDKLVRMGRYANRSDVIRHAIRTVLEKELWSANISINKKRRGSAKVMKL